MSYTITIRKLALFAFHGVLPEEKKLGQRYYLDIVFCIENERGLETDDIAHSVSYADVAERAAAIFTAQKFNMIETAAARVADGILAAFPTIDSVSVTVAKPSAPVPAILDDVTATVERRRNG